MSGAEDDVVLADILETAGQRAEEIRVEIASLKEKTGNNAVTVPQLLKGDAVPDVTEPTEATRQDEPDASLQFTVSTPSGERQAPPKTEDGTDTEDLERVHAALHSSVQGFVRSSANLAAGREPDAAGWPGGAADVSCAGASNGICEAAGNQLDPGSWQGLYQGMLGKLHKSQATEQQCASNVVAILKSAGMASAVDSSSCNVRLQHLATPFAHDTSQAAAVAAGAITSQHLEDEAAASCSMLPSPVHVVDGPYHRGEGAEAAATCTGDTAAEGAEQCCLVYGAHSPSKRCNAGEGGSFSAVNGGGTMTPKRLVVPPSAADLPVQAVIDELDELLSWSSRTPTYQQQQQQGQGRLFSRSDNMERAEEEANQRQQQGGSSRAAATAGTYGAAGAGDEEDWVLRWLRSQKGHMSRCNSTSCLLSDEYMQRSGRSSNSSNSSRMRRSCSLPTEPLSRSSMSAGGLEGAAACGGGVHEEAGARPHKQQQHDADIKEEILAHLRLAAAFRPRGRDSPNNSTLPNPCTPPAAAAATPFRNAAAAATGAAAGPLAVEMAHGASLVDWAGMYSGMQPASAVTGSSSEELDPSEARLQLLCGGGVGEAGTARLGDGTADASSFGEPMSSSFSITGSAATAGAAAVDDGVVPASPKTVSKSAQLYQQLLLRSHGSVAGSTPKGSAGGGSGGKGRQAGGRGSYSRSHSQGGGSGSPVKARGSTTGGVSAQQVPACDAGGGWLCGLSDPALQRSGSPGRQRLELQLSESQAEHEAAGCSSVTCTACGSPVLCGRPGTNLQHTRMSVVDLTAELAAADVGVANGQVETGKDGRQQDGPSNSCNSEALAAHVTAAAPTTHAAGCSLASSHSTATAAAAANNVAFSASVSLAALMDGAAHDDSSTEYADAPGFSSLCLQSPAAAELPQRAGSQAVSRPGGSAPATPKGSNHRKQQQTAGYAGIGRQSGYAAAAAASSRRTSHVSAVRMSYAAAGRLSASAGTSAERVGRQRAGAASIPGAAAAGGGGGRARGVQAEEVPAVTTVISCGQLLAAAALEQALGRVSAGGAAAAIVAGSAVVRAVDPGDEQSLEELQLPGVKAGQGGQQQCEQACNPGRPSLSGLLELERDMEEAALENELATLQAGSSTAAAAAAGQRQNVSSSVFVYRLQPTNEPGSGVSGGAAGHVDDTGGSSTAAAAAAAALQTLAACASRKVPRSASLSPSRCISSSVSPSRMNSLKQTPAAASQRSSSTDVPSRGSAGVSRSSSAKSSNASGFGSSSSKDGSSSAGSSRVWRPGGRRTSSKDDCRKLQDYESARSRILGPVSEAGAAGGSAVVSASTRQPSPGPSAFGRSSSPAKKPGRAGAAAAPARQSGVSGAGAKARGAPAPVPRPSPRGRVAAMATAAAAPTSKSARAAARAAAGPPAPRSPVAANRTAAASANDRASAAGVKGGRGSSGIRSRKPAAAGPETPLMQEQGVQADIRATLIGMGSLPQVPQLLDPNSLLDELSRKAKRSARQSTPGRLQAASRFSTLLLPGQKREQQQQHHQHGASSPTTSQVEDAIKAAQVALLQRRWQISQLRKTMAQHGITSTAGMSSSRSSSVNHTSLFSSTMHEGHGLGVGSGASSLGVGVGGVLPGGAGYSTQSPSLGRSQDMFMYDSLEAAGSSSRSQPLTPAAAVPAQLLEGFSRDEEPTAATARYRSASAFEAATRLCSEEPDMPLRPSSAQAVMKAAAAAAATATDQQHYTATIFATPENQQQQRVVQALPEPVVGLLTASNLGSRTSSCCKELNPLRRRSSMGSPAAAGGSAGNNAAGAAAPPWSAPRRVSSSGLTGEELMAYYRRRSVAQAAEAAADAAAAGEVPAAGLQLNVLLRAFNALAKRTNTVDKSAALAALMDQIMAVANQAAAAKQNAAAAAVTGGEPLAGMDARELTVDSDGSALALESSKLDVLGRSVNSSPRPADLLCDTISGRCSPGIVGGSVLQVRKGDMRAGWQSACAERQAAHDSLLSTPRHQRPASAGYAADLAALPSGASSQGPPWQGTPQQQQLGVGPDEDHEGEGDYAGTESEAGLSPTHAMLLHTAARLGGFEGSPGAGSHGGSDLSSCTGMPAEALAAAAPYGSGIVVVRMRTTEAAGRLPLLRDTAAGKAVLAGINGTSLTVQQAVHWLKVGLTRLPSTSDRGLQGGGQRHSFAGPGAKSAAAQQASRVSSPQSPSRRARSRPCSPFRACFASQAAVSSEEEEEVDAVDRQQQQQQQREGVHFEMDSSSQLVMVVPQSLTVDPQEGMGGHQQQQRLGGCAAGVQKYTVTGVALPLDEGVGSSGSHCLELITSVGRHRIELASERDFAGLLAGLNAMLLLKEAGGDAAEKLGVLPIEETAWAGAVEGWQGAP